MKGMADGMCISRNLFISSIHPGLIFPLFMIYAGIYWKVKCSFTLRLIPVIFARGMNAITSNPAIITLIGGFSD